jgi:hypothetical protein
MPRGTGVRSSPEARNDAIRKSLSPNRTTGVEANLTEALTIDNNTFYGMATPIVVELVPLVLRNNYFAETTTRALSLALETFPFSASANIFMSEITCSGCPALGASNRVLDCVLRDPANGDYSLSTQSPCIDLGVDVGLPYLGSAPDVGAFEER